MNKRKHIFLEKFEGPLDLLLYLIERDKIDIYDIPIAEVTRQYLGFIYEAQNLNMEVASEFLVMATKLLAIKAKMLLPKVEKTQIEEDEEDTREELIARLLEYKKYKKVAEQLQENEMLMSKVYFREFDENKLLPYLDISNPVENISIMDLTRAFNTILKNKSQSEPIIEINREEITLQECMSEILECLERGKGGVSFNNIFENKNSKLQIIVTFLALLELIKRKQVKVLQNSPLSSIIIFKVEQE